MDANEETILSELAIQVGKLRNDLDQLTAEYTQFREVDNKWSRNVNAVLRAMDKDSDNMHAKADVLLSMLLWMAKRLDIPSEDLAGIMKNALEENGVEVPDVKH